MVSKQNRIQSGKFIWMRDGGGEWEWNVKMRVLLFRAMQRMKIEGWSVLLNTICHFTNSYWIQLLVESVLVFNQVVALIGIHILFAPTECFWFPGLSAEDRAGEILSLYITNGSNVLTVPAQPQLGVVIVTAMNKWNSGVTVISCFVLWEKTNNITNMNVGCQLLHPAVILCMRIRRNAKRNNHPQTQFMNPWGHLYRH